MTSHNPFPSHVVADYFSIAKDHKDGLYDIFRVCFYTLDTITIDCHERSCHGAIESSLLDLWSQAASLPLYQFIGLNSEGPKDTFFTVSLNKDMDIIRKETIRGLEWTPYLKLKVNDDLELTNSILTIVKEECDKTGKNCLISIDANAAWSPEVAIKFVEEIVKSTPLKEMIFMVEQPYPVAVSDSIEEWKKVKELYSTHKIPIFGDESVCTYEDVELLSTISHGVNVKLDKTGGIRNALRLIKIAKEKELQLWVGMMVASQLGVTTASNIIPITLRGDLDGSFLITPETNPWNGGCSIDNGQVKLSTSSGLGISLRK